MNIKKKYLLCYFIVNLLLSSNEETMALVEGMVFNILETQREQANRERFILPTDKEVKYFSDTIDRCIDFFK